ncbi:Homeobox-leucine zipper protein ROC8 [Sesamum alatum]|uniref:Homeobox-leucine zipper protein ROC8 n=1 Tax=Sesamum alatum TaxID=300844 RepID=A0AAE2CQ58_9LAMI|nr:Homeobox-leucine zipper protein ROC8 [Sesamum alatum]
MDSSYGGNGSGEEETSNSQKGKKQYHRHSTQQIQQLEAFYKECPHPDKNQRQQLSRELGLDQKQIKFWFQNKRTQIKAQNERADNNALRAENERIHCQNLAMQEALKNIICPACNGSGLGEEEKRHNLQRLRMENARLKEEHERTINFFSNYMGNSTTPLPGMDIHGKHFLGERMGITPLDLEHMPHSSENPISPHWSSGIQETEKSIIIETTISAMDELVELLRVNEPVWVKAPSDGRYLLHRDSYDKLFPKPNHFKTASARFESSKDSGEVSMAAIHLIEMLLDANKWKDMFPTIVTKAKTIEVLDTGSLGGLLHLMYEKLHILSPLVAPREFFFIRYCRQLNLNTWVMVDVSYDFIKELQDAAPTRSWKLPSGCMIEDMSNGKSTVTWIEHVQVDDKSLTHRLYRDLVCGCQAYGAKRWITTLQRMCERFAFSMGLTTTHKHELEGVIDSLEGRRNLMKLSHRMMKNFCEALSMSDKLDFPHLSEFKNSGVRVSLRKSNGLGQPDGFIVSAATSLWLPISNENLFNFFKDEKRRVQWDVLSSGNPVNAVAHISTGTHPGNCISIIQPFVPKENNMLMLQESSIDPLGAVMIYAPIDLQAIISVVNGEDTMRIPILPSGYVISSDGRPNKGMGASSSSSSSSSSGSLLTVAFQILVCHSTLTKQLNMESVATVHTLISSTIQKIKAALDYSD